MKNYIWIITLLANVLIITSTNVDRPKRHLAFIKKLIANSLGYNMNNAIMSNRYNIPYPYFIVPDYQIPMNIIPDPYMNPNAYQGLQQKIFLPGNMVIQPVNYFQRQYVPYVAFDNNYKRDYVNFKSLPMYGNRQRLIPVPNYNRVAIPITPLLPRSENKNLVFHKKQITKHKDVSFSKPERLKLQELQNFRNTEKKIKEINNKGLPSSQSSISKNITVTPNRSRLLVKKIQRVNTSTICPNSDVNVVQNPLSSLCSPTTSTTETIQISTLTPSTFNNAQESITPNDITTLSTSVFTPLASVNNAENSKTVQPIILIPEKIDEGVQSTSRESIPVIISDFKELGSEDEINNKNNSSNTSKIEIQTSTLTTPTFTNAQESTTSHGMTSLTTSLPPPQTSVKNVENSVTTEPIIPTPKKINEEIQSTSTVRIPFVSDFKELDSKNEINNKNNPSTTSVKLIQMSNLTPPNYTNAQGSTISHAMSTLTTSLPPPLTTVKNVNKSETVQPTIPTRKKTDEEIQSTSTMSIPVITSDYKELDSEDDINNKNNPITTSIKLMSILTPPTFTNAQESTTSHGMTSLTTSLPSPQTSVKNVENSVTAEPIIPTPKKINEEIQSTSTVRIPVVSDFKELDSKNEINNKNNPSTTSVKLIQMSNLTPPNYTNAQGSTISHAMSTLTTSLPPPLTTVKNVNKSETVQPTIPTRKKTDEEIQSTSTMSIPVITSDYKELDSEDDINNKNNPSTTSIKLMSILTPPTFTNAQESTTSHGMTSLTTSLPSPQTSVKNVENSVTAEPIIPTPKKINEEIQSTSTVRIPVVSDFKELDSKNEINNKNNPSTTSVKLIQMSNLTPPNYTNAQGSTTSHAMSTLTTSLPPPLTSVKNVGNSETAQSTILTGKKTDEEIQSTSTVSIPVITSDYKELDSEDEINNMNNPSTTSIKLIQMSTLTPPNYTNAQGSTTSHAMSTLTTSLPPPQTSVKNVENSVTAEPIIPTPKKINEVIQSTSTVSIPFITLDYKKPDNEDEINNNNNPSTTSIKFIQMSTLTPPTFTNAQESTTSHAMSTLTTSLPPPLTSVKNVGNSETAQSTILTGKKTDEEIQSTSTVSIPVITSDYKELDSEDEINNMNNPSTTSIKLIQMSTLTPPTFTNAQESTSSHAMSTLTTSLPPPLTTVKNVNKSETVQPTIPTRKKTDEEIQSTSTMSIPVITSDYKELDSEDDINNKNNPSTTSIKLMSILTPPTFTNAQESTTLHAMSTLTTSLSPPLTSVKNVGNSETAEPIIPTPKKIKEEIQSTSTVRIPVVSDFKELDSKNEINNKNNPSTTSVKLIQMSNLTPPNYTNAQGSTTSHAMSTLTTSLPPPQTSVKNVENSVTAEPIIPTPKKINEVIQCTSTMSIPSITLDYKEPDNEDEINNNNNPSTTSIKFIQMSTITPPTFTNAQESTTLHAMSTLTTSLSPPLTSVKNVGNSEIAQSTIPTGKKTDEEIQSTSTVSIPVITSDYKELDSKDEINNMNNPSTTSIKLIQMSTLTPPTFTNAQESTSSHAMSTLTTSLPPPLISVKNVEISETAQPTIPTPKKIDDEIQSTSTVNIPVITPDYKKLDSEDEINNKNNSRYTSKKLIQTSTLTPPTFANEPESITPSALTLGSTLIASTPSLPLPVTNEEKIGITQPTMLPLNELFQETNSTSTSTPTINADYNQPNNINEMNIKFNPHNSSKIVRFTEPIQTQFLYKKVNSNNTNEDPVFKMENIKYPNASESQGDFIISSMFNHIIDVLNSIAPIRGKVLHRPNIFIPEDETDTNDILEERNMDDMEIINQSTEVYPSKESDFLNRSPIVLDDDFTYVPERSGSGSNDHFNDGFSWSIPSDSDRDISRGDVPDVCCE